jgi:chromosome segregation ATPase
MSWFDILKQTMDVAAINRQRESESQKRLREHQQQLKPKEAEYSRRFQETPASFAPATEEEKRRAASIGGFEPTLNRELKERGEQEQRKIEEAWAEKQRLLERRRTQLGPEINQINQALNNAKQQTQRVLNEITTTQSITANAKQKLEEAKNALKQYPILSDMLGHLEGVEALVEGRFSE